MTCNGQIVLFILAACSHRRSVQLYYKSINPKIIYKAVSCENQNQFEEGKCKNNVTAPLGEPWLKRY